MSLSPLNSFKKIVKNEPEFKELEMTDLYLKSKNDGECKEFCDDNILILKTNGKYISTSKNNINNNYISELKIAGNLILNDNNYYNSNINNELKKLYKNVYIGYDLSCQNDINTSINIHKLPFPYNLEIFRGNLILFRYDNNSNNNNNDNIRYSNMKGFNKNEFIKYMNEYCSVVRKDSYLSETCEIEYTHTLDDERENELKWPDNIKKGSKVLYYYKESNLFLDGIVTYINNENNYCQILCKHNGLDITFEVDITNVERILSVKNGNEIYMDYKTCTDEFDVEISRKDSFSPLFDDFENKLDDSAGVTPLPTPTPQSSVTGSMINDVSSVRSEINSIFSNENNIESRIHKIYDSSFDNGFKTLIVNDIINHSKTIQNNLIQNYVDNNIETLNNNNNNISQKNNNIKQNKNNYTISPKNNPKKVHQNDIERIKNIILPILNPENNSISDADLKRFLVKMDWKIDI